MDKLQPIIGLSLGGRREEKGDYLQIQVRPVDDYKRLDDKTKTQTRTHATNKRLKKTASDFK